MRSGNGVPEHSGAAELFLHIGLPKTGTSSIQRACFDNDQFLRRAGILYPHVGMDGYAQHRLSRPYLSLGAKLHVRPDRSHRARPVTDHIPELCRMLDAIPTPSRLLVSSELFGTILSPRKLALLSRELSDFDTKIIISLRRQDHLVEAMYAELLRTSNRFRIPLSVVSRWRIFDFERTIRLWGESFGPENLHVQRYDPLLGDELTRNFLRVLGVNDSAGFRFPQRENDRLSRDALEYLNKEDWKRFSNGKGLFEFIDTVLVPYSEKYPTPERFEFFSPPSFRAKFLRKFESGNRRIGAEYLGDEEAFSDKMPGADDDWAPYPGLTAENRDRLEDFIRRSSLPDRDGSSR